MIDLARIKNTLRPIHRRLNSITIYNKLYRKAYPTVRKSIEAFRKPKPNRLFHAQFSDSPVNPKHVLLDSFWGRMVGCNPYALYRQMKQDPRCDGFHYFWTCNAGTLVPADVKDDPNVTLVAYQSAGYIKAMLTAKYLIANTNFPIYFIKKKDQIFINPWHGTPIKKIGLDGNPSYSSAGNTQRNYFHSDFILSYSNTATERTVSAYGANLAQGAVHEIGTPRIDLTLQQDQAEMRQRLDVPEGKKVILYAPTWRGGQDATRSIESQVKAISAIKEEFESDYVVFVSLHHITAQSLGDQNISVREIPKDIPINCALAAVDILISDYSSIVVDYLCLDRPISLYCPDYTSFAEKQGFYEDLTELPVHVCYDLYGLVAGIKKAAKPSSFSSHKRTIAQLLPYEDGGVCARALDLVFGQKTPQNAQGQTPKKRIVIYGGGLIPNGITSSLISLSNSIDHNQYALHIVFDSDAIDKDPRRLYNISQLHPRCHFVLRRGGMTYLDDELNAFIHFKGNGTFRNPRDAKLVGDAFTRETQRIFGNVTFDVAIDFSGYSAFWAEVMSKADAPRKLIYQHNDMYLEAYNGHNARSFPELPAVFSLYGQFSGVVSVTPGISRVNKTQLADFYGEHTEFLVARNAIDVDTIKRKASVPVALVSTSAAAIKQEDDLYKFVCVARLSPEKNHDRLLRAFAKVLKVAPRTILTIVGTGKLAAELRNKAIMYDIDDHVVFEGHLDNPYPVINMSDCMVLASNYEGQGIVLLEALTLNKPCIATDNPAVRNVLEHDVGVLTEQNVDSLAKAMIAMRQSDTPFQNKFDPLAYRQTALQEFYDCLG